MLPSFKGNLPLWVRIPLITRYSIISNYNWDMFSRKIFYFPEFWSFLKTFCAPLISDQSRLCNFCFILFVCRWNSYKWVSQCQAQGMSQQLTNNIVKCFLSLTVSGFHDTFVMQFGGYKTEYQAIGKIIHFEMSIILIVYHQFCVNILFYFLFFLLQNNSAAIQILLLV